MLQGLIDVCIKVLEWLISLLPSLSFFDGFIGAVNNSFDFMYNISPIVPFSDLFICIGLISSFYVALFAIKCINWIIHRVPILN